MLASLPDSLVVLLIGMATALCLAAAVVFWRRGRGSRAGLTDAADHAPSDSDWQATIGPLAHELGNLLVPIIGYVDLHLSAGSAKPVTEAELHQDLSEIRRAAARAQILVRHLDALQDDALQDTPHRKPFALDALIGSLRGALEGVLAPTARLSLEVPERLTVTADRGLIGQTILHLALVVEYAAGDRPWHLAISAQRWVPGGAPLPLPGELPLPAGPLAVVRLARSVQGLPAVRSDDGLRRQWQIGWTIASVVIRQHGGLLWREPSGAAAGFVLPLAAGFRG